jgi:hypothetical protein
MLRIPEEINRVQLHYIPRYASIPRFASIPHYTSIPRYASIPHFVSIEPSGNLKNC